MRIISAERIITTVERLCIEANYQLPGNVQSCLQKALDREESPLGKQVLQDILENAEIAGQGQFPLCQDTGFAVVFLELGQEVRVEGGDLKAAINEGVRRGYEKGYLRKSMVDDPIFKRINTGDNTPAIIHTEIVPGDQIKLIVAPKGGGSENMSALKMLKPAEGSEGVKRFVLDVVSNAGPNPCPPLIVGVGVGGTFEMAALKAKKALLRPVGEEHREKAVADLERELLAAINSLGVGPQGFGGRVTALAVHIETSPTHIASLPVAVNLQCHAARHREAVL
ncbi:MAG: fumarate hydratase [bacterium]